MKTVVEIKTSTESEDKAFSMSDRPSAQQRKATPPEEPLVLEVIRFMQDQWFLITLAIMIAIASQHQVPKEH